LQVSVMRLSLDANGSPQRRNFSFSADVGSLCRVTHAGQASRTASLSLKRMGNSGFTLIKKCADTRQATFGHMATL
jgi:hypothetical protein